MKNLTIRAKITLWFITILAIILGLAYVAFYLSSENVSREIVRNELEETVTGDMDKIVYHPEEKNPESADGSIRIPYEEGMLEVDQEFLALINGIGVGLWSSDRKLIYGEDLIREESGGIPLVDSRTRTIPSGPDMFYVYDRKLEVKGVEGLWLRGSVDRDQRHEEVSVLFRSSLLLLPFLILLAAVGGYFITKRSLYPIRRLMEAAGNISTGSDLKQRIDAGEGENEVQQLTRSFNGMMQRLDEAFEAETQFTSDVSHELRTPMASILAQCELALEDENLSPEEARDALLVIQRQGDRMNELIGDMLMYTRIDRGQEMYPREPLDLTELVRETCEDFEMSCENQLELATDLDQNLMVTGSEPLLRRLLLNLLENAVRYSDGTPRIRAELTAEGRMLLLKVSDRGIGIPPEHLPKIFDRFYQADPSRTGEGTGLGLAMVKEIASAHGGSVSVASTPGEGSTFTVRLPKRSDTVQLPKLSS